MALIPIVLEFSGVAKDASLSLTLMTSGAGWAIGDGTAGDTAGFSYNGLALGETPASCLASIELTDSVLGIRTSASATVSTFTLSLFLDVQADVESVQGHCTLNAGATVACHLGYDSVALWRSGSFSAIVRAVPEDVRRIRFNLQRPPAGVPSIIDLMIEQSEPGIGYWAFDVGITGAPGLSVRAEAGASVPLRTFAMSDRQIVVVMNAVATSDVWIEAYLRRITPSSVPEPGAEPAPQKLGRFHLRASSHASAPVIAQVGVQRPQYLAASYGCFYF